MPPFRRRGDMRYLQFYGSESLDLHNAHAYTLLVSLTSWRDAMDYKYNDCAATISLLTFCNATSNFCSNSSLPITFAAWPICRSNSSKRRKRRMREPS